MKRGNGAVLPVKLDVHVAALAVLRRYFLLFARGDRDGADGVRRVRIIATAPRDEAPSRVRRRRFQFCPLDGLGNLPSVVSSPAKSRRRAAPLRYLGSRGAHTVKCARYGELSFLHEGGACGGSAVVCFARARAVPLQLLVRGVRTEVKVPDARACLPFVRLERARSPSPCESAVGSERKRERAACVVLKRGEAPRRAARAEAVLIFQPGPRVRVSVILRAARDSCTSDKTLVWFSGSLTDNVRDISEKVGSSDFGLALGQLRVKRGAIDRRPDAHLGALLSSRWIRGSNALLASGYGSAP